jgi:hypothetical protein
MTHLPTATAAKLLRLLALARDLLQAPDPQSVLELAGSAIQGEPACFSFSPDQAGWRSGRPLVSQSESQPVRQTHLYPTPPWGAHGCGPRQCRGQAGD